MLKSILFITLFTLSSLSFAHATALKDSMIKGVKFLDDVSEVEWYRVEGRSVIIGWKGVPQFFTRLNRRAATRATISTGREISVWAVRHNQKKWKIGGGEPHICFVIAKNGRVKTDTCPH
jgi:hypothetical protein